MLIGFKSLAGDTNICYILSRFEVSPLQGLNINLATLPQGFATLNPGLCCAARPGLFLRALEEDVQKSQDDCHWSSVGTKF